MKENFALVILNKNDASSLDLVLKETDLDSFDRVLGIDGNSTDNSVEVFKKYGIECISNIPGGRGGAIKYAINNVMNDFIIFLSSDGEENPVELSKIMDELRYGADLVIASRMSKDSSGFKSDHNILYIHRKLFLLFISTMIQVLFGGKIKDCWNGYRGLAVAKAKGLNLDANDFLLEAQMTIRFLKSGFVVREVPTVERPRYFGESQNPAISSGWGHLVLLYNEFFDRKK
jgi:glycosyltransferase involved in cell wall biosynthesis